MLTRAVNHTVVQAVGSEQQCWRMNEFWNSGVTAEGVQQPKDTEEPRHLRTNFLSEEG